MSETYPRLHSCGPRIWWELACNWFHFKFYGSFEQDIKAPPGLGGAPKDRGDVVATISLPTNFLQVERLEPSQLIPSVGINAISPFLHEGPRLLLKVEVNKLRGLRDTVNDILAAYPAEYDDTPVRLKEK